MVGVTAKTCATESSRGAQQEKANGNMTQWNGDAMRWQDPRSMARLQAWGEGSCRQRRWVVNAAGEGAVMMGFPVVGYGKRTDSLKGPTSYQVERAKEVCLGYNDDN